MGTNSESKKFTLRLLLAWIALLAIFAMLGNLIFQNAKEKIKEEKYHELTAISQLKINEIAQWRAEQLGDAKVLSSNQSFIFDLKTHFAHEGDSLDHKKILNWLLVFESAYKYQYISVVDKNLKLRFSTIGNDSVSKNDLMYIQNSIHSKQTILTDLYNGNDGKSSLKIIVPLILTSEKELVGVLILGIDPTTFLFPLIQIWPTPSKTAETLILRKEGDHVLYLSELRHQKNRVLNFEIPLSRTETPAVQAALGKTGFYEGTDYRGVRVLSSLAGIPDTNWLMVAKVDEDEIFESINQQGIYRFSFLFILVILVGISGLVIRRQKEKYLRKQYLAELDRLALQKNFEYISKYANDIIMLSGGDGKIIEVNDAAVNTYGYFKEELLNMSISDLHPPEAQSDFSPVRDAVINQNRLLFETVHQRKDGTKFYAEISSRIIDIEGEKYSQSIIRNITERKRFEIREHNRSRILEYIVEKTPLPAILDFIVSTVETEDPASICSIHVLDEEGKHLLHGAAPSLPDFYNQAMDGIEIGERVGSCGTAAYTKKRVIVSDIHTHPYWTRFRELAQQAGLKSCWSEPIISSDDKVLGTFAIYHREPKLPDQEDLNHLKNALDFAGLAIERGRTEEEIIKHREHLEELVEERTLALKESEERFRIFFNSGSDIIFVSELKESGLGNFIAVNDVASKQLGYTRDELLKMSAYDINASRLISEGLKKIKKLIDLGSLSAESIYVTKEGKEIPVEINSNIINLQGKKGVLSIVRDISSRKEAEDKLRKLSRAVEQSPTTIFITNLKGEIEYANPSFTKVTGYSLEEVIGQNPRILQSGVHPEEFYKHTWDTILSGNVWQGEICNKKKNGELYWEIASISPIKNEEGIVNHFVAVKEDISERKKLELELVNAKEVADSANRAKSEFLANMSHEIRTPMNAIIGFSELLLNSVKDEKQKSQIQSIRSSGKNLLRIINDILDLSKIEADKIKIKLLPVDLAKLANEVENMFVLKLKEKGITFTIEFENPFPQTLLLDEVRMRQILFNLIGNAVKFTDKGHVTLKLAAQKKQETKDHYNLTILVEDTGIGIPADQQEIIFQPFSQQLGQSSTKYGGTGLGLTITKKLIAKMGGTISVDSQAGKGSNFKIVLPNVLATDVKIGSRQSVFDPSSILFEEAKVLLADDNEEDRKLIVDLLANSRLTIFEATNGKETIEMATEYLPDLILMDLRMPMMNGYEAAKILKKSENTRAIPIMILTASPKKNLGKGNSTKVFDEYILKPLDIAYFFEKMKKYLAYKIAEKVSDEKVERTSIELTEEQIKLLPELLNILENKFTPVYQRAVKSQMIDQIEKFGKDLVTLAEENRFQIIQEYSNEICTLADSFEIDKLMNTLKRFPEIIDQLKSQLINN